MPVRTPVRNHKAVISPILLPAELFELFIEKIAKVIYHI